MAVMCCQYFNNVTITHLSPALGAGLVSSMQKLGGFCLSHGKKLTVLYYIATANLSLVEASQGWGKVVSINHHGCYSYLTLGVKGNRGKQRITPHIFQTAGKNCQRENHIIFLFYTLTSLESLFISLSLFGLPNTYSLVHFWRGTGKGGAGEALLPPPPLLAGWETKGLTVLLLLPSFPSTCISQKNPGRLPKLPQNMNSLKRWIHMVAEAAPSSSGYHCHEECSEKRDLSSPRKAWKMWQPFRELDSHCSIPALSVFLGSEVYFGIEMRCTVGTSLLEPQGYPQSLTEESEGTSGTNIRMTRHGVMRVLEIQSVISPF